MQAVQRSLSLQYSSPLQNLPTDLLKVITQFLTPQESYPLKFVSKKFSFLPTFSKTGLYEPGIKLGSIAYLNWINLKKYPLNYSDSELAASEGKLKVLIWLRKNNSPMNISNCYAYAALKGHFKVLKWFKLMGFTWDTYTTSSAAFGGHLEVLKWLKNKGCPWDEGCSALAAKQGHLVILKWLRENGCPWDDDYTCSFAAEGGQIETLKWLRENGCPWSKYTCAEAANNGQLDVLKWLRENGCPWDRLTSWSAAGRGHFKIVQWLWENGCDFDESATCEAAYEGYLEIFKWLVVNGCPWSKEHCLGGGKENIKNWILETCKE